MPKCINSEEKFTLCLLQMNCQADNSDIIIVAEMMFTLSTLPESEQLLVIGKVLHGVVLHSPIDQLN